MTLRVYDYYCKPCDLDFERFVKKEELDKVECPKCKSRQVKLVPTFAGYQIWGSNSSSVRPKNAGSFKRNKK